MRHLGVHSQGAETLAIFHQLTFDEWTSGNLDTPLARTKVDATELCWNDRMGCGAKLGKLPSPKARSSGWMEASCSFHCGTRGSATDAQRSWYKETLTVPWSAFWHWGRQQLRHDCVLLNSKPQVPSLDRHARPRHDCVWLGRPLVLG